MAFSQSCLEAVQLAVDRDRLVKTAIALVEVPSPTLDAGAVSDRLADILHTDGFEVARPEANWPKAPAVAVWLDTGRSGRRLQFDGHLDTVHLPFVPPRVEDGVLYGSGASDMKGGVAALVEALRVLRETDVLEGGRVLLTAHDHHEGPWGDKRQVKGLIEAGFVGDAVMMPEYLADRLPLAGRGMAIFDVKIERDGEAVHEVLRPEGLPDVLGAGADLVRAFRDLNDRLANVTDPHSGSDSVFVGQIEAGEIYNQAPITCCLRGTRRWVTPGDGEKAISEFQSILDAVAQESGTRVTVDFLVQAEAFRIAENDPIVQAFQGAYERVAGKVLSFGGKPFVDDGNRYAAEAGIPALTHGPDAKGAHTTEEWVAVDELVRVATVYALTAVGYCGIAEGR